MRRILILLLCLSLLLAGCGGSGSPAASSAPVRVELPMDFSVVEQYDTEFRFSDPQGTYVTMIYSPVEDALLQLDMGMRLFDDFDSDDSPELSGEMVSGYTVYNRKNGDTVATVSIHTAPADPFVYYGVETQEEVARAMQSSYFKTENYYKGLRSNIAEDFNYALTADWTGSAYGLNMFYLEYFDTDKNTDSLRMYLCNDELNGLFYSMELKADVPRGDEALLEKMRAMFFSLKPMGTVRVVKGDTVVQIGLD